MKKKFAALLISLGLMTATAAPANAWYGGYYGGWGYGGAAIGAMAGAAILGGVVAGAIASQPYYGYGYGYGYAPYYAVPAVPVYRYNPPVYYYEYYGW